MSNNVSALNAINYFKMTLLLSLEVLFLLEIFNHVSCNYENKRIVYHSDDDVIHVMNALKAEVALLKNRTADLESKVATLESNDAASESELTALKAAKPSIGVSYIRWGRTTCPGNGTEFIYKGYMAGADYTETGGGANHLCLPEDPTWSKYVDGYNNGAEIYGTEIELDSRVSSTIFGKQTSNQDIPCAVCRSIHASRVMVPARANCYPGWTQEYAGYIVASHPTEHKADYVCLDVGFEFAPHGAANDNDHLVRPVEVRCGSYGSLPCPPFVDGRELACVVCTK